MIIFILAILNWTFIENQIIKFIVSLTLFIIAENERKNGSNSKLLIVGEFICVFLMLAFILLLIVNFIMRFL